MMRYERINYLPPNLKQINANQATLINKNYTVYSYNFLKNRYFKCPPSQYESAYSEGANNYFIIWTKLHNLFYEQTFEKN